MVKIALGSFGDSFSVGSLKAYLSEFIATLLFVFAGVGSAIAFGNYKFNCALIKLSKLNLFEFLSVNFI